MPAPQQIAALKSGALMRSRVRLSFTPLRVDDAVSRTLDKACFFGKLALP